MDESSNDFGGDFQTGQRINNAGDDAAMGYIDTALTDQTLKSNFGR